MGIELYTSWISSFLFYMCSAISLFDYLQYMEINGTNGIINIYLCLRIHIHTSYRLKIKLPYLVFFIVTMPSVFATELG